MKHFKPFAQFVSENLTTTFSKFLLGREITAEEHAEMTASGMDVEEMKRMQQPAPVDSTPVSFAPVSTTTALNKFLQRQVLSPEEEKLVRANANLDEFQFTAPDLDNKSVTPVVDSGSVMVKATTGIPLTPEEKVIFDEFPK